MNTTLAKTLNWEKETDYLDLDLNDLVESAGKVIVPLGPISTFAARSPWAGLEENLFETVARRLKDTCNIDIYPGESMSKAALSRGDIQPDFLKTALKNWLDSQVFELPRETAWQFCMAALMNEENPEQLAVSEVKSLARRLSRFKLQIAEPHAVKTYSQRLEESGGSKAATELNRQLIKWCKLFLDESQSVWAMPNREEGFYLAWRKLVQHDPALKAEVRKQLSHLPQEAEQALMEALSALGIPFHEIQGYLEAHLLALPGWAGMMLWRSEQTTLEKSLLTEYLAVRLSLERALIQPFLPLPEQKRDKVVLEPLITAWAKWGDMPISQWAQLSSSEIKARFMLAWRFDQILRSRLWLEAWEKTYEEQLMKLITTNQSEAAKNTAPALAQFVFCIDVRSEPFRRKLEKAGPFETFGTAGFFGLPIETCELGSSHSHNSLPVMFKPQYKIIESTSSEQFNQFQQRQQTADSLGSTFITMKHNLMSSMLLPEISGPWLSIQTLARSFVPRSAGNAFRKFREHWLRKPSTKLSLDHVHTHDTKLPIGFSEEEKVHYVRQALKMMDLTDHFAPLVVICGHGSHSTNNPYASALDCGACGGKSSGTNARVLAEMCNLPSVRQALAKEGITIPKDTVFSAAEHITSLDELHWLYVPALSNEAQKAFDRIQAVLPEVSVEATADRIVQLPNFGNHHRNPKTEAARLSEDWSEVRPEWGLARNASFVIGDRDLTEDCDLEARAFLQNYNWKKDKNGAILDNIINGPITVAQWINLQYYASTVAPHYYGSGNKATQTVTSGLGVMQGNASDLLSGLPWQSVMKSDGEAYHEPIRLLVVIQAPVEYIKRALDHNPEFKQKIQNGWIRLSSIDPEGSWKSWS